MERGRRSDIKELEGMMGEGKEEIDASFVATPLRGSS